MGDAGLVVFVVGVDLQCLAWIGRGIVSGQLCAGRSDAGLCENSWGSEAV